jgi:hypothetical protein
VLAINGDRASFVWRLRYDPGVKVSDELAAKAFASLTKALDDKLGPAQRHEAGFVCRERAERGPFALAWVGRDLVFVLGPATTGVSGWASAGDCGLARKWIREVASAR